MIFSETHVNTGLDPLERPPTEGIPPIVQDPTSGQLDLNLQQQALQQKEVHDAYVTKLESFFLIYFIFKGNYY